MSPLLQPLRQLTQEVRMHGPALLAGIAQPHDELMSLVWGPRFDREHALGLLARQPAAAMPALPALLASADAFDALHRGAQQRLRELIRRHRALSPASPAPDAGGGCHADTAGEPARPATGGAPGAFAWRAPTAHAARMAGRERADRHAPM